MRLEDAKSLRKACMALSRENVASYEYLIKQPIYELLNICECWKEMRREQRGG